MNQNDIVSDKIIFTKMWRHTYYGKKAVVLGVRHEPHKLSEQDSELTWTILDLEIRQCEKGKKVILHFFRYYNKILKHNFLVNKQTKIFLQGLEARSPLSKFGTVKQYEH